MSPSFNVAVLLYPGADLVDFAGPLEIYTNLPPPGKKQSFSTTTFALQSPVKSTANGLTIVPDASFQDIRSNLNTYDILIVPGAVPGTILEMLKTQDGKRIISLLQEFAALRPREETGHRLIQSVCTGALLLAAAGLLANRTVTTHHMGYDLCKKLADEAAGGESNTVVAKKRWMDAGLTDEGVRIVNAGGVTSGLDASLYVVEMLLGKEMADWTAEVVEFERRSQDDALVSKENAF